MAKIVADVFDHRLLKYADVCLIQAARSAPKGHRISVNREGLPVLTFRARGEAAYYKVFDKFENCLGRHRPKGKRPCRSAKGKKAREACRKKMDALRAATLAKFKKRYRKS